MEDTDTSMSRRARVGAVALVLLVVLAGCSGAGGDGASLSGGDQGAEVESGDSGGGAGGGDGADGSASAAGATFQAERLSNGARERAIIRTGQVRVRVDSFENASASLTRLAREQGGYVSGTEQRVHGEGNRTWTSGTLVLRVPSGNFSAVYDGARGVGTVEDASTDTREVTDQLVDLNARIENLQAQRDRLRTLYENANETEAILEVSRELSDVQGEIERLQAQRRSLRERVAMSTLTVELHEPRPEGQVIARTAFHETGLVSAFLESVNGVVVAIRTTAVAVAYALPYLLAFGLPLAGLAVLVYRQR
jgi:hypothetical protein